MTQADGTIRIDTLLNAEGFNQGIKNLSGQVSKLTDVVKGLGATFLALMLGQTALNSLFSIFSQYNLMWSSMGSEIYQLNWAFQTMQGAWANLLATAIQPMIPYLIMVIHWLTGLLQYITVIVAALFGMSSTIGNITKKTDMLASFDKINKIGQLGPAASPPPITVPPELLAKIQALKDIINQLLHPLLDDFLKAWNTWGDWVKTHPALIMTLVIAIAAVALVLWLVLTPLGLITLLIIGLIVLAVLLTNNWNQLGTTIQQLGAIWVYALTHPFDAFHNALMAALLVITIVIAAIILLVAGVPLAIIAAVMLVIAGIALLITHFSDVKEFFRGIANDIIGFFNAIARASAFVINGLIDGLNALNYLGLNPVIQHVTAFQVPYLASGAVIQPNAPFMAMLGDQRNGRNIEAPESLLRQIVREEMGNQRTTLEVTGSNSELRSFLKSMVDSENIRVGSSLVKRTGNPVLS